MPICSQCGSESPEGSAKCARCGASLIPPADPHDSRWVGGPAQPPKSKSTWIWVLVVVAGCSVCCVPIVAAILFPVFAQARRAAQATVILSHAKQVDLAVLKYASDHNEKCPRFENPAKLVSSLGQYVNLPDLELLVRGFEWNPALSGKSLEELEHPDAIWVFVDLKPDYRQRFNVAFADGHVKAEPLEAATEIIGQEAAKELGLPDKGG